MVIAQKDWIIRGARENPNKPTLLLTILIVQIFCEIKFPDICYQYLSQHEKVQYHIAQTILGKSVGI